MSKDKPTLLETLAAKGDFAAVAKVLDDDDGRTPAEAAAGFKRQNVLPGSIRNNPDRKT